MEQLDAEIRAKADGGHSARLTAGFCWPWSNPDFAGTLVNDVKICNWEMPWNAKPHAGRLADGVEFTSSRAGVRIELANRYARGARMSRWP